MIKVFHYAPDLGADGTAPALCGVKPEAGRRFTPVPHQVTCKRGPCSSAAVAEQNRLAELRSRAEGGVLLFLDFDGVLNHGPFFQWRAGERAAGRLLKGPDQPPQEFDRPCVARLNRLCAVSGAGVVVSSSWRLGSTVRRLQGHLDAHGFTGTVLDVTPDRHMAVEGSALVTGEQRGDEIRAWLDALPVGRGPRAFVVIDDDGDMDAVREHFVKTDFHGGGLTDEKVDEALAVLARQGAPALGRVA